MIYRFSIIILFNLLFQWSLYAQVISDFHQKYSDDPFSWDIYTDDQEDEDDPKISLELNSVAIDDLYLWDIRTDDYGDGEIRRKWREKDDLWQINYEGSLITARLKWRGDYSQWSLQHDGITYTLRKNRRSKEGWTLSNNKKAIIHYYGDRFDQYADVYLEYEEEVYEDFIENFALPLFSSFLVFYHEYIIDQVR